MSCVVPTGPRGDRGGGAGLEVGVALPARPYRHLGGASHRDLVINQKMTI
jgi:hypothetical protein